MTNSRRSANTRGRDRQVAIVLADTLCREIVGYFSDNGTEASTISELSSAVAENSSRDRDRILIELHHIILPRLERFGVVEYDWETGRVAYYGSERLEAELEDYDLSPASY